MSFSYSSLPKLSTWEGLSQRGPITYLVVGRCGSQEGGERRQGSHDVVSAICRPFGSTAVGSPPPFVPIKATCDIRLSTMQSELCTFSSSSCLVHSCDYWFFRAEASKGQHSTALIYPLSSCCSRTILLPHTHMLSIIVVPHIQALIYPFTPENDLIYPQKYTVPHSSSYPCIRALNHHVTCSYTRALIHHRALIYLLILNSCSHLSSLLATYSTHAQTLRQLHV
jgi:hypothetical protein